MTVGPLIRELKDKVVGSTTALFSHGPQPLEYTLDYDGDPGLLGPDSVSWRVIGDAAAFVGGVRALLVQTAHPEVVAGVEQHSRYRTVPPHRCRGRPVGRRCRSTRSGPGAHSFPLPSVAHMTAALFGSIGTVVDTSEIQRESFNRAFAEHGLSWSWGRDGGWCGPSPVGRDPCQEWDLRTSEHPPHSSYGTHDRSVPGSIPGRPTRPRRRVAFSVTGRRGRAGHLHIAAEEPRCRP